MPCHPLFFPAFLWLAVYVFRPRASALMHDQQIILWCRAVKEAGEVVVLECKAGKLHGYGGVD